MRVLRRVGVCGRASTIHLPSPLCLSPLSHPPLVYHRSYYQGPILDPSYPVPPTVASLATYRSEIHYDFPNVTTGVMVNTPALLTTTFGAGRVLASSPHPEETVPMLLDVIRGYVLWVGKAI